MKTAVTTNLIKNNNRFSVNQIKIIKEDTGCIKKCHTFKYPAVMSNVKLNDFTKTNTPLEKSGPDLSMCVILEQTCQI